jgi:WD40 repeat protein
MVYVVSNVTANVQGYCRYSPSIHLWDVETRSLRYILPGHAHAISWIGISSNNLFAASISYDGTARVWDVNAGVCLQVIDPQGGHLWCGAFSPDSKYLAISQQNPNALLVYDIAAGNSISSVEMREIIPMAWSPGSSLGAVGLGCGSLCLLDPYTGVFKMQWSLGFKEYLMQSYASIRAVQFLDEGKKLAFLVIKGTVEVYDFETNLKQQFTRDPKVKIAKCPRAEVVCSHDSKFKIVADVDEEIRIWNI